MHKQIMQNENENVKSQPNLHSSLERDPKNKSLFKCSPVRRFRSSVLILPAAEKITFLKELKC